MRSPARSDSLRDAVRESARVNFWPVAIIALYAVAAEALSRIYGFEHTIGLYSETWLMLTFTVVAAALVGIVVIALVVNRPANPLAFTRDLLLREWRIGRRLLVALPLVIALPAFFSSFTSVKSAIGLMNDYDWDLAFVAAERAIHGTDAWRILQPVLGFPAVTFALNLVYHFWFVAFYGTVALLAVTLDHPRLRNQFVVAFLFTWIVLGSVGATLFASVGPCFFGIFHPNVADPFAPLLAYLRSVAEVYPIWVLDVQAMLLEAANADGPGLGGGIAAMPSVHVGIAALIAILGWKVSRLAGVIATAFMATVLLGSVHLGYHYAIDGYAAILAVPLIWAFSGWLVAQETPRFRMAPMPSLGGAGEPAAATRARSRPED